MARTRNAEQGFRVGAQSHPPGKSILSTAQHFATNWETCAQIMRTCMRASMPACTHACVRANLRVDLHACIHRCVCVQAGIHACKNTCLDAPSRAHHTWMQRDGGLKFGLVVTLGYWNRKIGWFENTKMCISCFACLNCIRKFRKHVLNRYLQVCDWRLPFMF